MPTENIERRQLVETLSRVLDARTALPPEAFDPEERLVILVVVSVIEPATLTEAARSSLGKASAARCVSTSLLEHWADRMLDAGRVDTVGVWVAEQDVPPTVARHAIARLLARDAFDDASTLARNIPWSAKAARALGLVDVWRANRDDGLLQEAVSAIVTTPSITVGTGRGFDEIEALAQVLEGICELGPSHPVVIEVLEHLARLGRAGQRQSKPTAFARSLARIACSLATAADVSEPRWADAALRLREDIALADEARDVDEALALASTRLASGLPALAGARPVLFGNALEVGERASQHFASRAQYATHEIARVLTGGGRGEPSEVLRRLLEALEPPPTTYPGALAAWKAAEASARDANLLEVLRLEPTPAGHWCTRAPEEVWDSIAALDDRLALRAAVGVLFERDFVTRAYPGPGGYRTPRSVATLVAGASIRLNDTAIATQLLDALITSPLKDSGHRLFDAIAVLAENRVLDLDTWEARMPNERDRRSGALRARRTSRSPSAALDRDRPARVDVRHGGRQAAADPGRSARDRPLRRAARRRAAEAHRGGAEEGSARARRVQPDDLWISCGAA